MRMILNDRVRADQAPIANDRMRANDAIRAEKHILADYRIGMHHRGRMALPPLREAIGLRSKYLSNIAMPIGMSRTEKQQVSQFGGAA